MKPLFFDLKSHIDMVSLDVDQLTQMEKCTLYEGLILISNEFEDIEVQKKFIQSLIEPINWIINYNISVEQFISEIGLDVNSTDEILGQKRANILFVVNLILGLLKRIKVNRKPSLLPHLLPLINGLLPLICNLNAIWKPEYQERCHEYHRSLVYSNITETDRMNVLDIPLNSINIEHNLSEKSDAYRMQTFIWSLHENCYCVLGVATAVMTPEIYDYIYDFKPVLNDLQFLPDWKLKMIVKSFLKPLITNCPISQIYFEKILLPIISNVFPFLFNKINGKWDAIKVRNQCLEEEGMKDDSEPVESELLSDQLNRLLSREFVELLISVLNSSKANDSSLLTIDDNNIIGSNDVSDSNNSISELGNYLLQTIPNLIIVFVAKSLSWLDTTLSIKTSQLNLLVLEKIIKDGMIRSEDGVYFLFEQIITALSYFGEHEQNQSILLQLMLILYEGITLKLGFNSIKLKLSEISGSDIREWNDFDDKLIKSKAKLHFNDKKKKDLLRKMLFNVIGVRVLLCF
jgi:exportin-5